MSFQQMFYGVIIPFKAWVQYYIAKYILEGKGQKPDAVEAIYWMKKSAENDYLKAQIELAWMYETGEGL
jgi:TPR repeat protein